jgi:ankyrin repeat protein
MAPDGNTPLLDAAREGHTEVVRILLEAGADPRITDRGNMKATPAHKAGYMGPADVARLLVADPRLELDAQGPFNGYTPVHDAIWHGHTETARVYIDAGARLDLRALDGRTPLEMAREYGYPEIVELLRRAERERDGAG